MYIEKNTKLHFFFNKKKNKKVWSKTKKNMYDLVLCSMFKNENLLLGEWIEHYIEMGVQHFYLIDNGSTDSYLNILQPYIDRKLVTLTVDPFRFPKTDEWKTLEGTYYDVDANEIRLEKERHKHTQAYLLNKYYLKEIKDNAHWVIVVDQDEYFFSKQTTLRNMVISLDDTIDLIWAPWRIFGTSGHEQHPDSIRRGFVHKRPFETQQIAVCESQTIRGFGKSISRVKKITDLGIHICQFQQGELLHLMFPDGKTVEIVANGFNRVLLIHFPQFKEEPSTDFLFLNHYAVMSLDYFQNYKTQRDGGADNVRDMVQYFERFNKGTDKIDTEILQSPWLSIEPLSAKEMKDAKSRKMHTSKDVRHK